MIKEYITRETAFPIEDDFAWNIIGKLEETIGKIIETLGDDCRIGANAVLSPGTLLKPDTIVGRLELIEQDPQP